MKPQRCLLVGNTSWGYCSTPQEFSSMRKAKAYAKEMVNDGYWFAYRIIIR